MDEDGDLLKATNDLLDQDSSSSSSRPSDLLNNNERVDGKQGKQNTVSKIAYGEETIPIIDKFAMNCRRDLNLCIDKNGPSVIINVPEITKLYVIFKSTSVQMRIVTDITSDNMGYCKQIAEEKWSRIKTYIRYQRQFCNIR